MSAAPITPVPAPKPASVPPKPERVGQWGKRLSNRGECQGALPRVDSKSGSTECSESR